MTRLFRDEEGEVRGHLSAAEGPTFAANPLDFFILLARYKFAARLLRRTDTVADAGCGHGLGSVFLRPFVRDVTGLDNDPALIEHCRSSYGEIEGLDFGVGDVTALEDLGRTWDGVVALDVIEHMSLDDGRAMAASVNAVLNPGGFAVIGTPNAKSSEYASARRRATHEHEYEHAELQSVLDEAFGRCFVFSMTDEAVGTGFSELAWYFMALCPRRG